MQRNRKQNQKGFSLVEVIVAMLMLSIVTVAVLTAFSQSARSNARSKVSQGAEDLCTNLIEFVEAGCDFFPREDGSTDNIFKTPLNVQGLSSGVQTFEMVDVPMGYNKYTVKVTKDNAPAKYASGLNQYDVITLGSAENASIMVDLSDKGCDADGDNKNDLDEYAVNIFHTLHEEAVEAYNAGRSEGEAAETVQDTSSIAAAITREVFIRTKKVDFDTKIQVEIGFRYILSSGVRIPAGASNQEEVIVFTSGKYAPAGSVAPGVTPSAEAKLGSIYLAFAKSTMVSNPNEMLNEPFIRVIGDTTVFGADIYIAYQDNVTVADAASKTITERMSGKKVVISFAERGGSSVAPGKSINVYCSSDIAVAPAQTGVVPVSNKLVATNEKVRAIGYLFEIYSSEVSGVVASGETVILQK